MEGLKTELRMKQRALISRFIAVFVIITQVTNAVFGLTIVASQTKIAIVYSSTASEASKNATLLCTFNDADSGSYIQWYKESSLLTNESNYGIQSQANISVLTIIGVTVNDIGNYSCNITNNQSSVVDHISVSVTVHTSITKNPESKAVIEGEKALNFTCDADGTPSPAFSWLKNGSFQLAESNKFAFFSNGKVLQINNINRHDAGNFTCASTNGKTSKSSVAILSVQYIDVPTLNISKNELSLNEKEGLFVKCLSTSLPQAAFNWISHTGAVVSQTDILPFHSISRSNAGRYFCNATNVAGSKTSAGLNVTVQYIDVPIFNVSASGVTLKENEQLFVKCSSTSLPHAVINWITDTGIIVSYTDTLSFYSISRSNAGRYFCNATNAAGSETSAGLNVTVQYIDVPIFNVSANEVTLKEKEQLFVKCSSTSLPHASINWITDTGIIVSYTDTLSFRSISRSNAGRYFCNATNAAGSKKSAGLNVTVQYIDVPIFNVSASEVTLKEKEQLFVKCSSTSLPHAAINWITDKGIIVSHTDTLSFNSISRSNAGIYFCNATNAAGSKTSAGLNVTVQYIDVPIFNISAKKVTLKENEGLFVKCSSISLPHAAVNWISDVGEVVSHTDTLSFHSISRSNAGRYFCNATNAAGSKTSTGLNVTVQYIDAPIFNISAKKVTPKENEGLFVKCSSTSLPHAAVNWISDAGEVVSHTDTLSFHSISRSNAGIYFCNATNAAGSKTSAGLNVTVQYIDVPIFNVSANEVTLKEKEQLFVKCSSTSLPHASINWITDTGIIVSYTDILSFRSISRSNAGRYFCNATNAAGSKTSTGLNVTVQYIDVPIFNVSVNGVTLKEKEQLFVKCLSTSLPHAAVNWITDTGIIVSYTDTLSFHSISRSNAGRYFCNATNVAGSVRSLAFNITVHYIDKPTYNASSSITLIEQDLLYVRCSTTSVPAAAYKWTTDKGSVISNSEMLTFKSINRNDSHAYFCNATNTVGSKISNPLNIDVHYIDKPTFNVSANDITLVEKSSLYVRCASSLSPAATFTWISSKGRIVSHTDMLIFNYIDRADAGRYTCNATNAAGSQIASLNITVQYIDVPTLNVSSTAISLIEESSLSILCTSKALPVAKYEWVSAAGKTVSDSAVLSFSSIHRNETGYYFCNAVNVAGSKISSNVSIQVHFIDAPKLNSSSSNIVLVEKSSLFIRCMSDAFPTPSYKWVSNKGKIVSFTSVLPFAIINRNDTGSYFCNASNAAGWKFSPLTHLDVQYIDVPRLNDSIETINEGMSLFVECSTNASPAATFQWIFGAIKIVSNSSLLQFTSITRYNKGDYTCKATNAAGTSISKKFSFAVQYLDSPKIIPVVPNFVAGNRESINCSATGYPTPSFSWKTDSKYVVGSGVTRNGKSYIWSPISVAHAGNYSCTASNAFGTKTTSVIVTVTFSNLQNSTIKLTRSITQTTATITLQQFNIVHGPIRYYQVIVKKLTANVKPVSNTDSLVSLEGYSTSNKNKPYITAEFAASVFDNQNTWDFIIGSGKKTNRTKTTTRFRRDVQEYVNTPLALNSYYTAFYRGYVSNTRFISSDWLTPFKTQAKKDTGLTGGQIAGIVIGVILFFAFVVLALYLIISRRKQEKNDKEENFTHSKRKRPSFLTRSLHRTVSDPRRPIEVNLFEGHVNSLKANGGFGFSQEYLMFSKELLHPYSHSAAPVNSLKNRYANIHPYDHSRVTLSRDASPGSDYINASYVDGFNSSQEYIAAQGPLPETVNDFWRMVWEQNSCAIVMLTRVLENGRPKCAQYWPSQGSQSCNDLVVSVTEILEFPDHLIRTFHLTKAGQSVERVVKQFHFIGWPDHGVPSDASALFSLLKKVWRWRASCPASRSPLVVHCSAGVGRTGTYIALDTQINKVMHRKTISIFENVADLRDQRCFMVQTEDQYAYLHHALLEYIQSGDTEIQAHDLREYIKKKTDVDPNTGSTGLMDEFISLAKSDAKHSFQEANKVVNQTKNRYKNVYPYDTTRVKLNNIPGVTGSDYINASYIDGYTQSNAFIATQAPLPGTIADFWRMVWELDCRTIVMLSNEQEAGRVKVNKYWPDERSVKAWNLIAELLNNTEYPEYTLRQFKITNSEQGHSRIVRQFQYTAWPENSSPESAFGMIDLIGQVCKWNTSVENRIVTVHCSAGVGRTGLFIALTNLIERLKTEAVVDVYQAVKRLRQQRTAMVQTREQYEFCYRALQEYLDSFDHYANFE